MNSADAVTLLNTRFRETSRTAATPEEYEANTALGILLSEHRQLQQKYNSTRSQLNKCQTDRARIHLQLRSKRTPAPSDSPSDH